MKAFLILLTAVLAASLPWPAFASPPSTPVPNPAPRILLIPLDDRPPCLQWPVLLGPIGQAEVVAPPRELLGRFLVPGDPEGIAAWVREQDLAGFDAAVISLDMLAYGGLVASRIHSVDAEDAINRLQLIREIREARPELPLYGFNIIMRLAPTADGRNDAWRGELERWAQLAPQREGSAEIADELERLEARIPPRVLEEYQRTRTRNLAVNQAAIGMTISGILNSLILGQDDAKPTGVHIAERAALLAQITDRDEEERIAVQPGADELGMLLLARALLEHFGKTPTVRVVYSSATGRDSVAAYEDRPLHETVSLQIRAAGAREAQAGPGDVSLYVFTSRREAGVAESFADQIHQAVEAGEQVIVADVDTVGDVQGASPEFTEELRKRGLFPRLAGYASWNTAANTLGTALPQGLLQQLRAAADEGGGNRLGRQALEAQASFLVQRLVNDYAYHTLVRPEINRSWARERGMNPLRLSATEAELAREAIQERVLPWAEALWNDFSAALENVVLSDFRLALPWGRTFEAEIDFKLTTSPATVQPEATGGASAFSFHGVAAKVSRSRGAVVVDAGEDAFRLAVWLHDHRGGYGLLMIEPETGETTFHEIPFETWDSPFAVLYSSRGYLYTLFGNHFVEFDPRAGEFTHVAPSDDRVAMWMTEADDGRIWAGNYPDAHLVSFDPATRELRDYGPVNEENWPQYPRGVATDAAGWVYTMIGFTRNHILGLDPATGEIRPMVAEEERFGGNVTLWRGEDGKVYARMPAADAPWLQLFGGEAVALEGAPPAARVSEISDNQQAFFGRLPDGREITRLNMPDAWLELSGEDGQPRRISFDYPSEGSWIFSLATGPDGRIYGSTGHPLRFFAFDPESNSFRDVAVAGGHVNAIATQAGKIYGAIYTQGILIEYEPGGKESGEMPTPRRLASAGDILLRPHDLLALSDGKHLLQVGTPGYGRTGGGMMIHNLETGETTIHEHTALIEFHSTKAIAELPDGNLIGGTTTEPGTGGERIAEECLLYIMEWPSLEIVYQEAILPGVPEIRELLVGPSGLVYGLDVEGTFFVFDWQRREVIHRDALSPRYGPITGGQAPRVWALGPDGLIYALFRQAIVRIDPESFAHEKLADTPVEVNIGVALHDGKLYFTSGSHLWSFRLPPAE